KISVAIQSEALRPAEATEENADITALRDSVDAVKAGGRRPRNVQIAAGMKCQVIRGDGRLKRGKNKNLAARADLENRAAAVANVQIAVVIKSNSRGDAHAFDPLLCAAIGRNAMDGTVVTAGNEEIAHAIERQAPGIYQRSDERLHAVICRDLVKRNGDTLASRAGKRDVNVAVRIDRGVRDGLKVVRNLQADVYGMRLAFVPGNGHAHHSAGGTVRHARAPT